MISEDVPIMGKETDMKSRNHREFQAKTTQNGPHQDTL